MNTRPKRRKPMSEINVVPYIDVMLVLLVIFMVTAPILTQGVVVELPKAPSQPIAENKEDPLVVTMRGDGALFLNLGIRKAQDQGTRVTIFSLGEQAAKIIGARPDVPVYVRADRRPPDRDLSALVRALRKAEQRIQTAEARELAAKLPTRVVGDAEDFEARLTTSRALYLLEGLVSADQLQQTIAIIRAHTPLPQSVRIPRPEEMLHQIKPPTAR